ncbi:MAG TPA: class I SAM-dependent methyltransferase [Acidimicrobiales bacterium]|nr:class I SAM-dependent methyltransferase [Acidimicrobiales bacterium]
MATSFEYSTQARTYDTTRAASPSVTAPLAAALGAPTGAARLLDVGGGTGNYAVALAEFGWRPVVVDRNRAMLEVAVDKGVAGVQSDAAALPVATASVDAVVMISMLHHVPDWRAALGEARRVIRPGGVAAIMVYAREHLFVHGIEDYFPTTQAHFAAGHQTRSELAEVLPDAAVSFVFYDDQIDGSLAALGRSPERVLDPDLRRQTSFFEWAEREQPDETARGLSQLAADLRAGHRLEGRHASERAAIGDAWLIAWPAGARG